MWQVMNISRVAGGRLLIYLVWRVAVDVNIWSDRWHVMDISGVAGGR